MSLEQCWRTPDGWVRAPESSHVFQDTIRSDVIGVTARDWTGISDTGGKWIVGRKMAIETSALLEHLTACWTWNIRW